MAVNAVLTAYKSMVRVEETSRLHISGVRAAKARAQAAEQARAKAAAEQKNTLVTRHAAATAATVTAQASSETAVRASGFGAAQSYSAGSTGESGQSGRKVDTEA